MPDRGSRAALDAADDADAIADAVLVRAADPLAGLETAVAMELRAAAANLRDAPIPLAPTSIHAIQGTLDALKRFLETHTPAHESGLSQVLPLVQALRVDVRRLAQDDSITSSRDSFAEISDAYLVHSAQDATTARRWGSFAAALSLVAVAVLLWGTIGVWLRSDRSSWFWVFVVASAGTLGTAAPAWLTTWRSTRSSRDNARLSLQLLQVHPYLDSVPADDQTAAHVMLAPRLFARILDDRDPMREPIWPAASLFIHTSEREQDTEG